MDQDEPLKSKRTADGERKAGHPYWTRSKAKRTSHCEDDGSESQSHQPPPKRRTRRGAKQAVTYNDNSAPIDSKTVDEYTSPEIALRNDLVLESLLRYMNRSDLLSCRVVNKQWQDEATKELRRRKLVIRFSFDSQEDQVSRDIAFKDICRRLSECRTPSLLSSLQMQTDALNEVGTARVTSIFTTFGNQLKHLTLHMNWSIYGHSFANSSLTTHLRNLLFRQAPNLEFLEIHFHLTEQWDEELETVELFYLPNLKTFNVTGKAPPKLFAHVMNAAVNLRSVGIVWSTGSPSSYSKCLFAFRGVISALREYSSACINYFLGAEGRDKIHLVKRFRVHLIDDFDVEYDTRSIELTQKFLKEHKQSLQLETFECDARLFHKAESFAPRIVGVINQILKCCAGSLQKLRIEPAKWFVEPLIIPPRLPQLLEICFDCFQSSRREWAHSDVRFFPPGFNMNTSCPNVTTIILLKCSVPVFRLFVSRMEIEMTEPVPSVQHILLIDSYKSDFSVLPLAPDFRRVFPKLLSINYVDKEKYYKI